MLPQDAKKGLVIPSVARDLHGEPALSKVLWIPDI